MQELTISIDLNDDKLEITSDSKKVRKTIKRVINELMDENEDFSKKAILTALAMELISDEDFEFDSTVDEEEIIYETTGSKKDLIKLIENSILEISSDDDDCDDDDCDDDCDNDLYK